MRAIIELTNNQVAEIIRDHLSKRISGRIISLSPYTFRNPVNEVIVFEGYKVQVEMDEKPIDR